MAHNRAQKTAAAVAALDEALKVPALVRATAVPYAAILIADQIGSQATYLRNLLASPSSSAEQASGAEHADDDRIRAIVREEMAAHDDALLGDLVAALTTALELITAAREAAVA